MKRPRIEKTAACPLDPHSDALLFGSLLPRARPDVSLVYLHNTLLLHGTCRQKRWLGAAAFVVV